MKHFFIILFVIFTKLSFGQVSANYYDVPELKPAKFSRGMELAGTFKCEVSVFEVITLRLDTFGRFNNYMHSCDGTDSLDSGNWRVSGAQLVLDSSKLTPTLDILQFGQYYILVPHDYKGQFLKEMQSLLKKAKRIKTNEYDFALNVLANLTVIVYFKKCST